MDSGELDTKEGDRGNTVVIGPVALARVQSKGQSCESVYAKTLCNGLTRLIKRFKCLVSCASKEGDWHHEWVVGEIFSFSRSGPAAEHENRGTVGRGNAVSPCDWTVLLLEEVRLNSVRRTVSQDVTCRSPMRRGRGVWGEVVERACIAIDSAVRRM